MNSETTETPRPLGIDPLPINSDPFSPEALFSGGGELGALMREFDWSNSLLGPIEGWSPTLRMMTRVLLANRFPMLLWWGPDFVQLYNDSYRPVLGDKHPHAALGRPFSECWAEVFHVLGPLARTPYEGGPPTWMEDIPLEVNRFGFLEETHFTIAYSPVPDDTAPGGIGGVLATVHEISEKVVGERRVLALRDLGAQRVGAKSPEGACVSATATLANHSKDLPFVLLYLLDAKGTTARLAGKAGVDGCDSLCPESVDLRKPGAIWPFADASDLEEITVVENLQKRFDRLPCGPWSDPPHSAAVVPIRSNVAHQLAGYMVAGISPRLRYDESYRVFLELASTQIATLIANARAYDQERRRAESLSELDRAKTTFFSNISHEFRTPLTLMLGPLEDMLDKPDPGIDFAHLHQIDIVHRNGLRLLKLVNTLLDFSRIEAGRVQALYRPVDLRAATVELASVFRSAMDAAGLKFIVNCQQLSEPVYIDTEMWEKIVLNLLSNALKFTLAGEVEISLARVRDAAQLCVRDTGVGIPESELPRVFERFHRVEGTRGRTHEGTGIGLALVDELVRLHGGAVSAVSQRGRGTTFTVRIPFGNSHLPPSRVVDKPAAAPLTAGALPYVQEALHWLPSAGPGMPSQPSESANQDLTGLFENHQVRLADPARVFLIDDSNDMREYVQRLLARTYDVSAYSDGEEALAAILEHPPDLVLTDIMMPGLDGFELLHGMRANPATAAIPVIMLSARAGEESRSEGMEAGANDYLVKPFTARELMARVGAHVAIHRLRSQLTADERTQRIKAEQAEKQYRTILESISEAFLFLDRDWVIRHMNEQAGMITGSNSPELVGMNIWQLSPRFEQSAIGQAFRKAMDTGEPGHIEEYYPPLDRWFHANIYPSTDGLSIFARDVTERRRQQQQLLTTEKLAATGRLAATIAHEINNPLESVLNLLYLARVSRSASPDEVDAYLLTAEQEITRVSQIARHTLGFYRETSVPGPVELPHVIEDVLTVYRTRLNAAGIDVKRKFNPVPSVHGLRGELHQILSNLVSNAIDAMPSGGRLELSLTETERDANPGIAVCVEDNGSGIPAANISKLFEPFFTTKASVGTGLGLWVVKQFVEEHGGTVSVESSTDPDAHGTRFLIFLPRTAKTQAESTVI